MADPVSASGSEPPPRPRWVKIFGLAVAVIVVIVLAVALFGRGEHGPGRHTGDDGAHIPPAQHGP